MKKDIRKEKLVMQVVPMLSLIIPVYNKEKYLAETLNSVLAQTYTNSEILLINDGSMDKSLEICEKFKEKCERIRIINQENSGASVARNRGIDAARGKYIIMLDADDTIESEMHEKMVQKAEEHGADIVVCNWRSITQNSVKEIIYNYPNGVCLERDYIENEIIPNSLCMHGNGKFLNAHCTLLIRRDMLVQNDIKYNITHKKEEDKPFIMQCLKECQRIVFISDCLHNYIKRPNSLISIYSNRFENIVRNFTLYKEWFNDIYDFNGESWIRYFIQNYEECIRYILIHKNDVKNVKKDILNIIENPVCKHMFENWGGAGIFSAKEYV